MVAEIDNPGKKVVVVRNVYVSSNLTTGRPYFERRGVTVLSPDDPANVPSADELPPLHPVTGKPATIEQKSFRDLGVDW